MFHEIDPCVMQSGVKIHLQARFKLLRLVMTMLPPSVMKAAE